MNFLWRGKKLKLVSSITNQQFKELSLAYAYFFKEFAENKIDHKFGLLKYVKKLCRFRTQQ